MSRSTLAVLAATGLLFGLAPNAQADTNQHVPPSRTPSTGHWLFGDDPAFDASGEGHDLTLAGVTWGAPGRIRVGDVALRFDGTSGNSATTSKVIDTDQSFSVDVWARLAESGTPRTIVAQHGPSDVDSFALHYDGAKWSADMPDTSTNPTTWWRATSTADAAGGTWTHLRAVYNASNRDGTGAFWSGDIDNLTLYQGV